MKDSESEPNKHRICVPDQLLAGGPSAAVGLNTSAGSRDAFIAPVGAARIVGALFARPGAAGNDTIKFSSNPQLWIGLVATAALIAAHAGLRRRRDHD